MSRRTFDDLLRSLSKSELATAYYFCGPEPVLREEAIQAIQDLALQPAERDFGLEQRSAVGLAPEELHSVLNTLPMFGSRRVVVVRDIEILKKKAGARAVLLKYLANPCADTVVILVEAAPSEEKQRDWSPDSELVATCYAVDFQPLPHDRVARWVAHQAGRLKIHFAPGAAEHLATACQEDLGALRMELEKLAALPEEMLASLTPERVGELVGVRHGETARDWRDSVLAGDSVRGAALLNPVLGQSGMSGVKLVTMLGTSLLGVSLARSHSDRGVRGAALERTVFDALRRLRLFGLGDWKDEARKWSQWAERWTSAQLREAVKLTLAADQALKDTRVSDEVGVMTGLVLQLGGLAIGRLASGARGSSRIEHAGV
jgi:DNA polymerase-3 subunit delta